MFGGSRGRGARPRVLLFAYLLGVCIAPMQAAENAVSAALAAGRYSHAAVEPYRAPLDGVVEAVSSFVPGLRTVTRLQLETTYHGIELGGREFGIDRRVFRLLPTDRLTAWWGHEMIRATGRGGERRFSTEATRYGVRFHAFGESPSALGLSFLAEWIDMGTGVATDADGIVTYTAPTAAILGTEYRHRMGNLFARYGFQYGEARGGTERASAIGGRAGLTMPLGRSLSIDFTAALYAERSAGGVAQMSLFSSTLSYTPVAWARIEAELAYAPAGMPVVGTPLTGISSFLIYRPGGAAGRLANGPFGYGTVRLVIGRSY